MAAEGLAGRRDLTSALPAALASAAVALQIAYPVSGGAAREGLTVAIVLAFAAAGAAHAVATRGVRVGGAAILLAGGIGFAAEVVGVRSGFPFGHYEYEDALGPRVLGVPVVVAVAWTMIAWPAALAARRLVSSPVARVAVGAWALAAWDLFLDPQMVAAGAWRWRDPAPHLPGVSDVPLSNYLGWCAVGLAVSGAMQWVLRRDEPRHDLVPAALYLWTWAGSTVALAGFLHRPAAAAWGAVGMGLVAVPLLRSLRR